MTLFTFRSAIPALWTSSKTRPRWPISRLGWEQPGFEEDLALMLAVVLNYRILTQPARAPTSAARMEGWGIEAVAG